MGRFIGSVCAQCRREGEKLFLKGDRCMTPKCAIERHNYPPGPHGQSGSFRRKSSDYANQLREKQKARRIYGVFERQFRRYFTQASHSSDVTGVVLLQYLERRFDNVAYRLGFAPSRKAARQVVLHGHLTVNGKPVNVPSFLLSAGDVIAVIEKDRKSNYFQALEKELARHSVSEWLTLDAASWSGSVINLPSRKQIDTPLKEQLIVEYYSR